jgi:hypothetical protein
MTSDMAKARSNLLASWLHLKTPEQIRYDIAFMDEYACFDWTKERAAAVAELERREAERVIK